MAVKQYKPTTPSRRNMTSPSFEEITKFSPEKSLIVKKKKHAGRNSYGKITVRHHGGGNKQKYRIIDFKRNEEETAKVIGIEYDPNRTSYIALLENEAGKKSYITAPVGVTDGDVLYSGAEADIKPGNTLPIENIPVGTFVYAIELTPGKGAQMVRAAGASAQLMAKEDGYATLRMPSGEVRKVLTTCEASIGTVSNLQHQNILHQMEEIYKKKSVKSTDFPLTFRIAHENFFRNFKEICLCHRANIQIQGFPEFLIFCQWVFIFICLIGAMESFIFLFPDHRFFSHLCGFFIVIIQTLQNIIRCLL